MQIIKKETNKTEIRLSLHEISALTQVFNYAGGAAKIDNFEQVIGVGKEKSREIMYYFVDLKNRIDPNSSIAKNRIMRKNCNLRSQKYDLCFYMKKIPSTKEDIRYLVALQGKGTGKAILKSLGYTLSIAQIRQDLILLKDRANSLDNQTDSVSFSIFNEAVKIDLCNSKLKEYNSVEESQLNVKFIFPRGTQFSYVDSEKNPETRKEIPFDSPKSFTSTLTLENITNFVTKVEDFFENKVNNNYN